jgi:hypothetical protein
MSWLLIHFNTTIIDKVVVIIGNWKKMQQYIINNIAQLYHPFFRDIIMNEHYDVNNNQLYRYFYHRHGISCYSDLEESEIISTIVEFYEKFPKKMIKTLKYYGGTNENNKYPIIKLIQCDDVTIIQ